MQLCLSHTLGISEFTQHLTKNNFRGRAFFTAFCDRVLDGALGVSGFIDNPATFSMVFGSRDFHVHGTEAALLLTLRGVRSARHGVQQLAAALQAIHLLARETIVATEFPKNSHWKRVNVLVVIELDAPIVYEGEVTSRLESVPEWVGLTLTAIPERGGGAWP